MGIAHDVALLDLSILLKEAGDLFLAESWMNAGDEEVGSSVHGVLAIISILLWRTLITVSTSVGRLIADADVAIAVAVWGAGAVSGWVVAVVLVGALVAAVVCVQVGHSVGGVGGGCVCRVRG